MKLHVAAALLMAALTVSPAAAQTREAAARAQIVPAGVRGDPLRDGGDFILSYRFVRSNVEGNRTGTGRIAAGDILASFQVAPLSMTSSQHTLEAMFAASGRITLVGTIHFLERSLDHITRSNTAFTTAASGIGDVSLAALIGVKEWGATRLHVSAEFSLPVGSINEVGVTGTSGGAAIPLSYPMRLGSGTFDLLPGLTVEGKTQSFSWGAQGRGVIRMGATDRGYSVGDKIEGTAWVARAITARLGLSARVSAQRWGDYAGHDRAFTDPLLVPTTREDLRGGTRIDIPLGASFDLGTGPFRGHRLAVEYDIPVYQKLNGPQLETDGVLRIRWRKFFGPGEA